MSAKKAEPAKGPCFKCKKQVELSEAECSGCNSIICSDCDKSIGLFGSHRKEEHLVYGDEGDE